MDRLKQMLDVIATAHFPDPPASEEMVQACQARLKVDFPSDVCEFYRFANGARLFDRVDPPYRIMSLSKLCHPSLLILGEDIRSDATRGFVAFCDVEDGNYLAMNTDDCTADKCSIVDCFHETFPKPGYMEVVANSFSEFLSNALTSDGKLFWL